MDTKQQEDITLPLVVYVLYLASLLVGVTVIIGLVVAYKQQDKAPVWIQSHYRYLIRTFWIGLVIALIGLATLWSALGYVILLIASFWFMLRCMMGVYRLSKREPIRNPDTWLYG